MNVTIFGKIKDVDFKISALISLQLLSETFIVLRRTERDVIKSVYLVFVYSTCYSCQILIKFEFSKITQVSDFMKIRPVGVELVHVDGRTDGTKLIVSVGNFANVPEKLYLTQM